MTLIAILFASMSMSIVDLYSA